MERDNDRHVVLEGRRNYSDPTRRLGNPEDILHDRALLLRFFVDQLKEVGFDENAATMLAAYQFNL